MKATLKYITFDILILLCYLIRLASLIGMILSVFLFIFLLPDLFGPGYIEESLSFRAAKAFVMALPFLFISILLYIISKPIIRVIRVLKRRGELFIKLIEKKRPSLIN